MPEPTDTEFSDGKTSRLLWWLHPKVALPLLFLVLLLLSPFIYRAYRIASIPDIGDPFDVEAFGTVDLASVDNAMTEYLNAAKFFRKRSYTADEEEDKALAEGWPAASEGVRKWLDDNQSFLSEWQKGTKHLQACLIQPKDFRFESTLEGIQEAREFARLARLQAEKSAHEGELAVAWDWLRDAVRTSAHIEQHGCLIQRLVGLATFDVAANGINRWAENPKLDETLLRKALTEYLEANRLTPANSVALKAEFVVLRNTFSHAQSLHDFVGLDPDGRPEQGILLYVMGEPEVGLKVTQHVFQNLLSEVDKPKRDRAPIAKGPFNLYEMPLGRSRCLPADQLDRLITTSPLARMTLPAYAHVDAAMQREAARRLAVSLVLACHLYYRIHGDWPAKWEDLIPEVLEDVPADPLGKAGEMMRLKRDGADLVIYSVGPNGSDDGGQIESGTAHERLDEGFRLKAPRHHEDDSNRDTKPQEKN